MDFQGSAIPLSEQALQRAQSELGAPRPAIWAVLAVETSGAGFLPDRRPKILFERHVFHRLTAGRFDVAAPDLSNARAGGYGAPGAFQYVRLARALRLDEGAALESASWGLGQVMGFNAREVGYASAQDMVTAFMASEEAHLAAMAGFVRRNGLHHALQQGDWAAFAAGYNGPEFHKNGYDEKLRQFDARYRVGPMPNLLVRWTQMALTFLQVPGVGGVDGWYGHNTQQALQHYQVSAGLPVTGEPDAGTVDSLKAALNWP
jgi:peptidoglycan hydrolase-like protein with peptidoglycan-binding domain